MRIKFPIITIILIGILITIHILSQTIIETQREEIAEELMRIEAVKGEVFQKNFNTEIINANRIKEGEDYIEYANRIYNILINEYFSENDNNQRRDHYTIQVKASSESLQNKQSNFIWNVLGSTQRDNTVQVIISSAASLFLHLNNLHLILSILMLWLVGLNAERLQGFWFFLLFLVGGGLTNIFNSSISAEHVYFFGAAPGIAVILGAYLVHNYNEEAEIFIPGLFKLPGIVLLIAWIAVEGILAFIVQTDTYRSFSFMHIGGLLIGVIIAIVFKISMTPMVSKIESEGMSPIDLARRDVKMSNFKGAISRLGDVLRKDSTNPEALKLMLSAYIASRSQQETVGLINYLIPDLVHKNKHDIAFDLYMDFSASFPTVVLNPESQLLVGKLLIQNNFFEMAVTTLSKAAQMAPQTDAGIESVLLIGKVQLEKLNQVQASMQMFNWIISNFPNHPLASHARQLMQKAQMGS